MSEFEKMVNSKLYNSNDNELVLMRTKAHKLSKEYSNLDETDLKRKEILDELIGNSTNCYLQGPIFFDYGINTKIGNNVYVNYNLTVLDVAKVEIGDNVLIGPNVTIATPLHPLYYENRRQFKENDQMKMLEYAKPITIENDCWIASNVTICPGVRIGKNSVIGANSVVTKDIPENSLACGNPCKVIRKITDKDKMF